MKRCAATLAAWAVAVSACGPAPVEKIWQGDYPDGSAYWADHGDANGDGLGDLLVGAQSGGGAVIFYGTPDGSYSPSPGWQFRGGDKAALTGLCVGFAGDLDGDGYQDIFVAAPRDRKTGTVFLFRGGPQGPGLTPWKELRGSLPGEGFGEQVVAAGDLNGDGYDDLAVADFAYQGHRGQVSVYHGSAQGPALRPQWQAEGEAEGDWFGYSLVAAGDLDGDGYGDLAISAKNCSGACVRWLADDPRFDLHREYLRSLDAEAASTLARTGRLYIYHGSRQGLGKRAGVVMEGEQPHGQFAFKVVALGDVDGDGRADLALSSPGWMGHRGKVELFLGSPRGIPLKKAWETAGGYSGDELGYTLASVGDLDGDGVKDLLVGLSRGKSLLLFRGLAGAFEHTPRWTVFAEPLGLRWGLIAGGAGAPGVIFSLAYSAKEPRNPLGRVLVIRLR